MTNERRVLVHPDAVSLAASVAARFLTKVIDLLDERETVQVCLTGGSMGIAVLASIAGNPARDGVDWSRVGFWWGDERYLPRGHADRNETQARAALLDALDVPAENIHAFPAPGEQATIDAAADAYAAELGDTVFDITFLGVGPDGHVASLFPDHATVLETTKIGGRRDRLPQAPARAAVVDAAGHQRLGTDLARDVGSRQGGRPGPGARGRERRIGSGRRGAGSQAHGVLRRSGCRRGTSGRPDRP